MKRRAAVCVVFAVVGSVLGFAQASRQTTLNAAIDALFAAHPFQQTEISPDGTKVAWVEGGRGAWAIGVARLDQPSAEPERITAAQSGSDPPKVTLHGRPTAAGLPSFPMPAPPDSRNCGLKTSTIRSRMCLLISPATSTIRSGRPMERASPSSLQKMPRE